MNGYVIDPMWFYWISVGTALKTVSVFVAILGLLATGVFVVCYLEATGDEVQIARKALITSSTVMIVFTLLGIFVPGEETLIKMKLAEFGTYENITTIIEAIENTADKIIEQMG